MNNGDLFPPEPVVSTDVSKQRAEIDGMSYAEMLRMVRCEPLSNPLYRGETGIYFHARMKEKRRALEPDARAAIHAKVGL